MRAVIVLALVAAACATLSEKEYEMYFSGFKAEFGKTYSASEETTRYATFKNNLDFINTHNAEAAAGKHGFTVGINEFADMSIEEFRKFYLSEYKRTTPRNEVFLPEVPQAGSVDWRTKGAVTPVKNQGQCGSCWSFSTTGSTEGAHVVAGGSLVSLSEQQLMDCSTSFGNQGCNGGLMDYAFEYIMANGGIDTEADYPYTAQDGTCNKAKEANKVVSIKSYTDVPHDNEAQLLAAATNQPISVAIEADQSAFQFYKSGVFDAACGTALDHGVLVVGYGTSTADYWIVKNSWGESWGDQGYIYMNRGVGKTGICGIAMEPSYPTATATVATPNAQPHYGDPKNGCLSDELDVTVTGVSGDFCSPTCPKQVCPSDVPSGTTAKPECILEMQGQSKPTHCCLVCVPGGSGTDGCPTNATCKSISSIGICTYDD